MPLSADMTGPARPTRRMARDWRGSTSSLLVAIIAPALLVLIGLVVDGGGQLAAARQAEGVAAQAARAGVDATPATLNGGLSPQFAKQAAEQHLRDAGVAGTVTVSGGIVAVHTTVTYRTVFLGLIGVHALEGEGQASARMITT